MGYGIYFHKPVRARENMPVTHASSCLFLINLGLIFLVFKAYLSVSSPICIHFIVQTYKAPNVDLIRDRLLIIKGEGPFWRKKNL